MFLRIRSKEPNVANLATIGKPRSHVFNVLDMASRGGAGIGYEGTFERNTPHVREIVINSFNLDEAPGTFKGTERIRMVHRRGVLPDCLAEEPTRGYDHVHFHMATADLDEQQIRAVFSEVNRVMKEDGLFFFSGDHQLFSSPYSTPETSHTGYERVCEIVGSKQTFLYRFSVFPDISPIMTPEAGKIAEMFGCMHLTANEADARWFFHEFSTDAERFGKFLSISINKSKTT